MKLMICFCHCCCRYSFSKAFCIAFVMTFFSVFDVPVFWPILLCYWFVLFVLTMRRQIAHMIKYKYVPFNIGKQVECLSFYACILLIIYFVFMWSIISICVCNPAENCFIYIFCLKNTPCFYFQKYSGKKSSASGSGSRAEWS